MWRASVLEHLSPLEAPRTSTFSIMVSHSDMLAVFEIVCSSAEENDLWAFINFNEHSFSFFV